MYKRGRVWWTCIRFKGRKMQKSLETSNKQLARDIEAKIRTEIIEGNYFEKSVGDNKTVREMMDRFEKEHAPKVSGNMRKSYKTSLKHIIPYFGNSILSAVSPKFISQYKILRNGEKASPASINREIAMLSKAFNIAVKEWEWIKENPVLKVPKERENNERNRWLTFDEEKKLAESSPEWLRDIIIFDLNTGLRQSELLSIQWSHVDLIRKTILIQHTKNGKPKTLPLNRSAISVLEKKLEVRSIKIDNVFIGSNGLKISSCHLIRAFNKALQNSGIAYCSFHSLRHTFATRLAQNGVDLYKISKLMGHKNVRVTQRYAHHYPESLRDGVDVLSKSDYNLTTMGEKRSELTEANLS